MMRMVAGKFNLAAKVDAAKGSGEFGKKQRDKIEAQIRKMADPGKGKTHKALPIPEAVQAKKRGGRRARKLKEKTQMSTAALQGRFGWVVKCIGEV